MVSMRMTGRAQMLARQRLHVALEPAASAATMSQVTVGGGDSATCGLLPTLISFIGAGVPHSVPSRMGASGTATAFRPFSRAAQRACASSISCADQEAAAAGLVVGLAGQQPRPLGGLGGTAPAGQPTATAVRPLPTGIDRCGLLRKRARDGEHAERCGHRQTFTGH